MNTVQVDVVTPERTVLTMDAQIVIAKGVDGEIGVMAGHVPLVTPLEVAPLRVRNENEEKLLAVSGGFLEIRPDKVTILAEIAELAEDIDIERAQEAKMRAEQKIEEIKKNDPNLKQHENDLQRAINRLRVTGKL